ncbi:hypothetical protein FIBSPDRAFT_1041292 [Athelia psychrophila]|uniref:Cell wall protein n=1 Tax=Athelia psychrophila TaxID=1759441 RepID=A0A166P3V5_9AGAM|nr:hypothetical protein FIBSPDRAFT_1041292 [Fibularhizoctonia sp. CBS 109695]
MKSFICLLALAAISSVASALEVPSERALGRSLGDQFARAWGSRANKVNNSTASASNSTASTSTQTAAASNGTAASSTQTAAAATRTRPCDQGDQSLAAALNSMVTVGLGQQASVLTLQGLIGGAAADFQTGVDRLNQFSSTSDLLLQAATGIADDGSLAQPQLALLNTTSPAQAAMVKTLSGKAADNATLSTLLDSFVTSTGQAQDGAGQALIDCFLPTNTVSG